MFVAEEACRTDSGLGMRTPYLERLGVSEAAFPSQEGCSERGVMARSLMYLFTAGGTITAGSLLLSPTAADQTRIGITAAAAFGLALVLLVAYDRLPLWAYQVFLATGTVLIEWAVYASGETTSPGADAIGSPLVNARQTTGGGAEMSIA